MHTHDASCSFASSVASPRDRPGASTRFVAHRSGRRTVQLVRRIQQTGKLCVARQQQAADCLLKMILERLPEPLLVAHRLRQRRIRGEQPRFNGPRRNENDRWLGLVSYWLVCRPKRIIECLFSLRHALVVSVDHDQQHHSLTRPAPHRLSKELGVASNYPSRGRAPASRTAIGLHGLAVPAQADCQLQRQTLVQWVLNEEPPPDPSRLHTAISERRTSVGRSPLLRSNSSLFTRVSPSSPRSKSQVA